MKTTRKNIIERIDPNKTYNKRKNIIKIIHTNKTPNNDFIDDIISQIGDTEIKDRLKLALTNCNKYKINIPKTITLNGDIEYEKKPKNLKTILQELTKKPEKDFQPLIEYFVYRINQDYQNNVYATILYATYIIKSKGKENKMHQDYDSNLQKIYTYYSATPKEQEHIKNAWIDKTMKNALLTKEQQTEYDALLKEIHQLLEDIKSKKENIKAAYKEAIEQSNDIEEGEKNILIEAFSDFDESLKNIEKSLENMKITPLKKAQEDKYRSTLKKLWDEKYNPFAIGKGKNYVQYINDIMSTLDYDSPQYKNADNCIAISKSLKEAYDNIKNIEYHKTQIKGFIKHIRNISSLEGYIKYAKYIIDDQRGYFNLMKKESEQELEQDEKKSKSHVLKMIKILMHIITLGTLLIYREIISQAIQGKNISKNTDLRKSIDNNQSEVDMQKT